MMHLSLLGILIRFIGGGTAIMLTTIIGRKLGGRIGGIFAAFPAIYLSAVITAGLELKSLSAGTNIVTNISKGALVGMIGNVFAAYAASKLIPKSGWKYGLLYTLIFWTVISYGIFAGARELGWIH